MRLDAVYLLAPKPKPPSVPTRRAFLLAGGTFVAGLGLGGACGYAAGVSGSSGVGVKPASNGEEMLESSGDADLDELRRLAVKAPIDELMGKASVFANLVRATYKRDPILWRGIQRIGEAIVADHPVADRRTAIWVAQVIENGDRKFTSGLLNLAVQLRQVR